MKRVKKRSRAAQYSGVNQLLYLVVNVQRVALGRAIVRDAKSILNGRTYTADAKYVLRCVPCEITPPFRNNNNLRNHDQTEAMTMADRIVIMKDGFVQQIGTPQSVQHS